MDMDRDENKDVNQADRTEIGINVEGKKNCVSKDTRNYKLEFNYRGDVKYRNTTEKH